MISLRIGLHTSGLLPNILEIMTYPFKYLPLLNTRKNMDAQNSLYNQVSEGNVQLMYVTLCTEMSLLQ